jgi:DNA-binding MarR family transcriptional regulator
MSRSLAEELKKRGPFDSLEQEATLAILRTSDLLENRISRLLRQHGLTMSQYNVLRILRGEGKPMPCLEVAQRMIQVAPAITRVVDQLLGMAVIEKTQSAQDRRVYYIEINAAGKRTLKKLDESILALHSRLLTSVSDKEMKSLIRILATVRGGVGDE